ncbi:MAG: RNA 2',3'-cyclic phosphodiesterase [Cyclobacteriaceae bacterium]
MSTTKPGESLYFIAIVPPAELEAELYGLKQVVSETFESKKALNSPAHITLHMPFKWKDSKLDSLIDQLGELTKSYSPFEMVLDGFSCFPPRVIYVDVKENDLLSALQSDVHRQMKLLNVFNANYKDRAFRPHITIAFRDLKKSMFMPAWEYFKDREMKRAFMVEHLTLLKHDGQRWSVLQTFPFES